jgi:hypothetical protein
MRKRNRRVEIYFTEDELSSLMQKVRQSGLSREAFCRAALQGVKIKEAPPADYYKLIMEVRRVGTNINQILQKANAIGLLDVPMIRKALEDNYTTEEMLWDAFEIEGEF